MSIGHKGFLLSDACVAVLIVSLCALITAAVLSMHHNTDRILSEKEDALEQRMENIMAQEEECIECQPASP